MLDHYQIDNFTQNHYLGKGGVTPLNPPGSRPAHILVYMYNYHQHVEGVGTVAITLLFHQDQPGHR
jgi:hypothetical protein